MQIDFTSKRATAQALITDTQNIGPDKWRHVEIIGSAGSETDARALAQEIKELLTLGRETHWRVPFEYKPRTCLTHGGRIDEWHAYGRFSIR